jgi:ParB-like chromosome segregation protein Spo0J
MQGFQTAPAFYQHIHHDLDAYRAFEKKIDAQDVATLPAAEALATGRQLFQARDSRAALPRLERVGKAPDATASMREDAVELIATAQLDLGQTAASKQTIEKLIASTKDADRRERAQLFRAQIPLSEDKPAEALALFQAFLKEHPQSKYANGVDAMIQKLQQSKAK